MVGEFARVVALPDDPVSPLRAPLSGEKRVSWSEPLDLQEVRTVSRALGCTVNDVLMSTVAGALGALPARKDSRPRTSCCARRCR
ncbi:MAG: hypothetical protein IPF50_15900 [Proteobacteria bacterium]|nr:hypothetical protein [Pseudomonadota bacterium]